MLKRHTTYDIRHTTYNIVLELGLIVHTPTCYCSSRGACDYRVVSYVWLDEHIPPLVHVEVEVGEHACHDAYS
jgi:hypothetical protein